jgi:outer membrane protein TolC
LCAGAQAQSLPALIDEALRGNREILAAQKRYEAARQRPSQERSLPDPMLSVGYTSVGYPYPGAGLGREVTANIGTMVSQEMPFPGKRPLRGAIAENEASAELEQYRAVRLSVIARLTQAYHELHHANVSITFTKRYQELLQNMLKIMEARYSVGRAPQQDIFKAQTQYSIFATQLLRYEQERISKTIAINALLNRPQGSPVDVPEEVPVGDFNTPLDSLLERARLAPMLAKEQKMVQRSELAQDLARKNRLPDYTVAGGYYNQGSMAPMWQVRLDIKIPAYARTKQAAELTERGYQVSEARHNYEAANVSVESQIRDAHTLAVTSRQLVDLYSKSVIPEAQLALESSMTAYETGTMEFLPVFSNFMNLAEYELMYHEEIMRFHVALARLEELTGGEL